MKEDTPNELPVRLTVPQVCQTHEGIVKAGCTTAMTCPGIGSLSVTLGEDGIVDVRWDPLDGR